MARSPEEASRKAGGALSTLPPHIHVEPPKDLTRPTPDPNQDAIAALRPKRSPASAFVGIACALAGLFLLYFGRSLVLASLCLAGAAIVVSAFGWAGARRQGRPSGVAAAGLLIGVVTALIVFALSR